MSLSSVQLGMSIGPGFPGPAPPYMMRALRRVEVTQQDSAPCGFQLTFLAEIASDSSVFEIVSDPAARSLQPRVAARLGGRPADTLIDGFITHHQYVPGNGPEDSMFVVTGEDISVLMDLVTESREYPSLPDDLTVLAGLAPWLAYGLVPVVCPPMSFVVPIDYVPQQTETDRALFQRLAQANGYLFYISPTPEPYVNTAYWGPPIRAGTPRCCDRRGGRRGEHGRVVQRPVRRTRTAANRRAVATDNPPYELVPVVTLESSRLPPLAAMPALETNLLTRTALWKLDQLEPTSALLQAQAITNASTDNVVTANCTIAPARLGTVVNAPAIVGVRGTGQAYDGLYYLKAATHQISLLADAGWNYTEELTMTREGTGATTSVLTAP